ncbi:MAG: hemolysin III family protein [Oscillospiraceae bacterium]|nr:hemolysin III family protein [Oscillospiraceae bacterium]
MKRTPLSLRKLPNYSRREEQVNMITHIVGSVLGIAALVLCVLRAASRGDGWGIVSSVVYGISMIATFAVSSIYHGMRACYGKKVMQVVDHCMIYLLIAGTYTAVVLPAIRPHYPALAWGLFCFEWGTAAVAAMLTAIDLKKYSVFSMICYITMGWAVIPFWRKILEVLTQGGFWLLLGGGIAYTIGSVLYGMGSKRKWMHSVFHIFVVLGGVLQFFSILLYAI